MSTSPRKRPGRGLTARLALALAVVSGATVLTAAPASAGYTSRVGSPVCTNNGYYNCVRNGWARNVDMPYGSRDDRGGYQDTTVEYSPNNTRPSRDVVVRSFSQVYEDDPVRQQSFQRMRLQQTFKALNSFGAQISVGWEGISLGGTEGQVGSNQVYLSMTRTAVRMERYATLAFPDNRMAYAVEHVSNSTLEYATGNFTQRLQTQLRLTDY